VICKYSSADTGLFVQYAGLVLPLEHDEKTVLMLKESTLTPTGSLLILTPQKRIMESIRDESGDVIFGHVALRVNCGKQTGSCRSLTPTTSFRHLDQVRPVLHAVGCVLSRSKAQEAAHLSLRWKLKVRRRSQCCMPARCCF
jgi:hypothetical protein